MCVCVCVCVTFYCNRTLQQRGYEKENERVKSYFETPQLGVCEGVLPLSHIGHHPQEDLDLVIGHVGCYLFFIVGNLKSMCSNFSKPNKKTLVLLVNFFFKF